MVTSCKTIITRSKSKEQIQTVASSSINSINNTFHSNQFSQKLITSTENEGIEELNFGMDTEYENN